MSNTGRTIATGINLSTGKVHRATSCTTGAGAECNNRLSGRTTSRTMALSAVGMRTFAEVLAYGRENLCGRCFRGDALERAAAYDATVAEAKAIIEERGGIEEVLKEELAREKALSPENLLEKLGRIDGNNDLALEVKATPTKYLVALLAYIATTPAEDASRRIRAMRVRRVVLAELNGGRTPEVGMPATQASGSDTYAGKVAEVSPSGHRLTVEFPRGDRKAFTRRLDGRYRLAGSTGYGTLTLGLARDYRDPSF